ncbi:hypothetical protein GQ53DRAFT_845557 [Thozetella sp. PMI_491]|nr:hypothetical protein GQ53DRAFT_845557 [Thozetella sp. PMI_491]
MTSLLQSLWTLGSANKEEAKGTPATQIIYLDVDPLSKLEDTATEPGKAWVGVLDVIEKTSGFQRLYWGRRLEEPEKVQLHIVRDNLQQHQQFLSSNAYTKKVAPVLEKLSIRDGGAMGEPVIKTRHAYLKEFTDGCLALGRGPPTLPIGTAIYLGTDDAWNDGAWPLWTHVVRYVQGCRGVSGGTLVEEVEGYQNNYLVYVAWDTVKDHDDYHHTKHFAKHRVILNLGNQGWREYGHVLFLGGRDKHNAASKL